MTREMEQGRLHLSDGRHQVVQRAHFREAGSVRDPVERLRHSELGLLQVQLREAGVLGCSDVRDDREGKRRLRHARLHAFLHGLPDQVDRSPFQRKAILQHEQLPGQEQCLAGGCALHPDAHDTRTLHREAGRHLGDRDDGIRRQEAGHLAADLPGQRIELGSSSLRCSTLGFVRCCRKTDAGRVAEPDQRIREVEGSNLVLYTGGSEDPFLRTGMDLDHHLVLALRRCRQLCGDLRQPQRKVIEGRQLDENEMTAEDVAVGAAVVPLEVLQPLGRAGSHDCHPGLELLAFLALQTFQPLQDSRILHRTTDEEHGVTAQQEIELSLKKPVPLGERAVARACEDDLLPIGLAAVNGEVAEAFIRQVEVVFQDRVRVRHPPFLELAAQQEVVVWINDGGQLADFGDGAEMPMELARSGVLPLRAQPSLEEGRQVALGANLFQMRSKIS